MRTTSAATAAALLAAMWIPTAWAQALAPAGQGEATALVPTGPAHPVPPLDAAAAQKLGAPRGAAPTVGADWERLRSARPGGAVAGGLPRQARDAWLPLATARVKAWGQELEAVKDAVTNPALELRAFDGMDQEVLLLLRDQGRARQALEALQAGQGTPADPAPLVQSLETAAGALVSRFALARATLEAELRRPTALVVSGGSSLGSYEAGAIYFYTRFLEAKVGQAALLAGGGAGAPPRGFSVVTGASAGAINSFLAALAACLEPPADPEASLGFMWTRIGLSELLLPPEPDRCDSLGGVLSRAAIESQLARVSALWSGGRTRWRTCDVKFGVAVALVDPRRVPVAPASADADGSTVTASKTTENFTFRIFKDDTLPAPEFRLDPARAWDEWHAEPGAQTSRADTQVRTVPLDDVLQILKASSGIPLVFSPVRVPYTFGAPPTRRFVQDACFMDGGVFDNVPLSTAIALSRAGDGPAATPEVLYIDPDNVVGNAAARARGPRRHDVLAKVGDLVGGVVTSARQAELLRTIQDNAAARRLLRLPVRHHPVTGAMMGAFGAFTDETFRVYDFHAGMADARAFLAETSVPFATLGTAAQGRLVDSPLARCFDEAWLTATELGRLPACRPLLQAPSNGLGAASARARRDKSVLRLLELARRVDGADVFRTPAGLLAELARGGGAAPFQFTSLRHGTSLATPDQGMAALREHYGHLTDRLAGKMDSLLLSTVVRTAVSSAFDDALAYRKVRRFGSLALVDRGLDAGLGHTLGGSPFDVLGGARFSQTCLDCGDAAFQGLATAYALLRWEWAASGTFQYQLGLGPSYRTSLGRTVHGAPGFDAQAAVQFYQRLFVSADYTRQPWEPKGPSRADFTLGFGFRIW